MATVPFRLWRTDAPTRPPLSQQGTGGFGYPRSPEEWNTRYSWLFGQYAGEPYSVGDIKQLGLFRALDDNGNVIAETRRITSDVRHVINTDASAIAKQLSLQARPGAPAGVVPVGEAIWRRGRVQAYLRKWSTESAAMGDFHVEAVWRSGGSRPVRYDPRHVELIYDDEQIDIEKAVITVPVFASAEGERSPDGTPLDQPLYIYRRTLTREAVIVEEGSVDSATGFVEKGSYRHNLGYVPLVHVPFIPFGPPEHGLWAAHGMEEVCAAIDSYMTQLRAIANRFANPILYLKGARLGDGSDVFKFGRVLQGIPADGEVGYLEPQLIISQLWEAIQAFKSDQRQTIPEFLFSGAGANTSGEALKLRASEFESKMEDVRGRMYGGLSMVTQMCAMLDDGASGFTPEELWYRIDAAPILPRDRSAWMQLVQSARSAGLITKETGIRHMQAIGLVDEEADLDAYAAELEEEAAEATPPALRNTAGTGDPAADMNPDDPEDEDADGNPVDE